MPVGVTVAATEVVSVAVAAGVGGTAFVLKPSESVTPLFNAHVAGSSSLGQQYPLVRQNDPPGQPSERVSVEPLRII